MLSNLNTIHDVISQCATSASERELIATKLLQLSPKKAGTFLEQFCRNIHTLSVATSGDHDAVCANGNVEIKCSRVISADEGDADNLLDEFLNNSRGLLNFSDAFSSPFDCNIQQVKPGCFENLYYYLIFGDCILSFRAHTSLFAISNKERYANTLKKAVDDKLIDAEYAMVLAGKTPVAGLTQLYKEHSLDFIKEELRESKKLASLKYSDKQHRGNVGEGQFHITNKNLAYHIEENFVAAHSYSDFKRVLKSIATPRPSRKIAV